MRLDDATAGDQHGGASPAWAYPYNALEIAMLNIHNLLQRLSLTAVPSGSGGPTSSAPLPAVHAPAPTPDDWAARYLDWLSFEGYSPTVDRDGDIIFKHEDWTILLIRDLRDPEYFRLALPNFWPIESEAERARALRAADCVNRRTKVAKLHFGSGKSMWVTVEMFVGDQAHIRPLLPRCIALLPECAHLFKAVMSMLDE